MISETQNKTGYDIIGDVHGCAEELKTLLLKLNYENSKGYYSHPEGRKVIFLGNFIDGGPKIRKTLRMIKGMCDNGTAEAILGNHEYNALCFWEINKSKGGYLRKHSIKNILQHSKTIRQFQEEEEEWGNYLKWLMTLPLFIEKPNIRAVHACWDQKIIDAIKNELPGNKMSKTFLHRSVEKNYKEYHETRITLKGWEMKLPKPHFKKDNEGHKKRDSRIKWWVNPTEITYGEYLVFSPEEIKNDPVPVEYFPTRDYYNSNVPLFIGHYLLNDHPKLQTQKVACINYGIEKGGELAAYRWDGESNLNPANFVCVKKIIKEENAEIS